MVASLDDLSIPVLKSKEIGLLLALGTKKGWLRRAYVWETFIMVLAASLTGVLIGTVSENVIFPPRVLHHLSFCLLCSI